MPLNFSFVRVCLLCLSLTTALGTVRAEVHCGVTLEWLTDTCPYIGVYEFRSAAPASADVIQVEATLVNKLRGKPPESVSFLTLSPTTKGNPAGITLQPGDKVLAFWRDAEANDVRLEQIISLTKPFRGGELRAALEPDFSVVTDGAAIEKIVRDRMAAKDFTALPWGKFPYNRFRLEIPYGTPAYHAVFGGSTCYLIVPDDLLPLSEAYRQKMHPIEAPADKEAGK